MFRFISAALFLVFLLVGCYQEGRVPPPEVPSPSEKQEKKQDQKEKPDTEFKKLHYVIYEKGRLKWDIFAEKAQIFKKRRIKLSKLRVCSSKQKGFCISSERGEYDPQNGRFVFQGKVVLDAGRKGRLYTSILEYFPKKETLESRARVRIENEGMLVKGRGFYYDLKTGAMKVLKRTKVRVDA